MNAQENQTPTTEEEAVEILAVAEFAFWWDDPELWGAANPVAMFNLTTPIAGHPKNSTVTRETILEALRRGKLQVSAEAAKGRKTERSASYRPAYCGFNVKEEDAR